MLYFAYGSNLCTEQMYRRCKECYPLGKAILEDYRLIFRHNGSRGVASILKYPKWKLNGGIYVVSDNDLLSLDIYEGVSKGIYHKIKVYPIMNGKRLSAITYIMNERFPETSPSIHYVETIIDGCLDFSIPPMEHLAEFLA